MVPEGVRRAWVVARAAPMETGRDSTEQRVTAQLRPSPQPTSFSGRPRVRVGSSL